MQENETENENVSDMRGDSIPTCEEETCRRGRRRRNTKRLFLGDSLRKTNENQTHTQDANTKTNPTCAEDSRFRPARVGQEAEKEDEEEEEDARRYLLWEERRRETRRRICTKRTLSKRTGFRPARNKLEFDLRGKDKKKKKKKKKKKTKKTKIIHNTKKNNDVS